MEGRAVEGGSGAGISGGGGGGGGRIQGSESQGTAASCAFYVTHTL